MTKKIFRNFILIASITLIACTILILGVLYNYFEKQLTGELKNQAVYISQGLTNEGISYFDNLDSTDSRITWIDPNGTVIYDNVANIDDMENHADRKEFIEALQKGFGSSSRYSSTLSEKTIYYARKLDDGTVIRVSNTQYTGWNLIFGMLPPILMIMIIVVILSALLASAMSKRIVRPINEIDLENPESNEIYEELSPLLAKIDDLDKDITMRISDAHRKQNEFTMITENMREGLIITDNQADILSYNTSALKIFNINEDIKNKNILTFNRSEKFRNAVHAALNGEHSVKVLVLNDHCYQVITNPVYNHKDISGIVMVILDVTEKEKRDTLRREFSSNVSHELKTPLTGIFGTSEIIMNGMVKNEDIPKFAENIYKESGRLITLINDIIKISQLDENLVPDEKKPVDLYKIAEDMIGLLKDKAQLRNISVELMGEHAEVVGISRILEEMIYNLCDNAVKYNKDHGKVTVSVKKEDGKIELSVSDTGVGIPLAHKDRVFERFYRIDNSRSKEIGGSGSGLGLSIVKHAASYHGATTSLESTTDVGTTITINFPL